jgi:hypothetical protein
VSERFDSEEQFSVVISKISKKIPMEGITLNDFLGVIGERGLLMSCVILTAPFLLPLSIPGSSIPFGLAIFLISIIIIFRRPILIPKRFMDYKISKNNVESILNGISRILTPLEKFITPRLSFLTSGRKINYINGAVVAFGAILLMIPLLAPLADFLPAYGILFVSLGALENDGYLILAGYITVIATTIYFALIFALGIELTIIILSHLGLYF